MAFWEGFGAGCGMYARPGVVDVPNEPRLESNDGYMLQDSNGVYLVPRKEDE